MSSRKKRKQNIEKVIMNTSDPLFRFIKPKNNDLFSDMSGVELQELLYYIDNFYLELRNRLGFDDYITFGFELEFEKSNNISINKKLNEYHLSDTWRFKIDGSLDDGAEINSPILKDKSVVWNNLKKVCSIISENATIGKNSGGHIHVGTQVLGDKLQSWLNFIKLWSVYENVIYRFVYGDYLCARSSMKEYAAPITKKFWDDYQRLLEHDQLTLNEIIRQISHQRGHAVNFNHVSDFNNVKFYNTIEFRCPNGSLEPVIWQNNVNLFINLLQYSKSSKYNDDIIQQRRIINQEKYSNLDWYGEIYLQQALELCDMVFKNNYDKVYFLRQYLKSFEIGKKELDKAKQFIKKY